MGHDETLSMELAREAALSMAALSLKAVNAMTDSESGFGGRGPFHHGGSCGLCGQERHGGRCGCHARAGGLLDVGHDLWRLHLAHLNQAAGILMQAQRPAPSGERPCETTAPRAVDLHAELVLVESQGVWGATFRLRNNQTEGASVWFEAGALRLVDGWQEIGDDQKHRLRWKVTLEGSQTSGDDDVGRFRLSAGASATFRIAVTLVKGKELASGDWRLDLTVRGGGPSWKLPVRFTVPDKATDTTASIG